MSFTLLLEAKSPSLPTILTFKDANSCAVSKGTSDLEQHADISLGPFQAILISGYTTDSTQKAIYPGPQNISITITRLSCFQDYYSLLLSLAHREVFWIPNTDVNNAA